MRSNLLGCARLGVLAMLTVGCTRLAGGPHNQRAVTMTATCTGNQVTLVVNPSSVHFKHTPFPFRSPTDVDWTLASPSNVASVNLTADAAWPFNGTTSFPVDAGTTHHAVGKDEQGKAQYRYTVTVACPNGGPTAIFDPDVWVD